MVSHPLLLAKMKLLGFNNKTLQIFENYLKDSRQYIIIDSFASEPLAVGPQSVTQGSTLSCALYLIFILNITQIFHNVNHNPKNYSNCSAGLADSTDPADLSNAGPTNEQNPCKKNAKTYVDDNLIHSKPNNKQTLEETFIETMNIIEDYTNANILALNPDKSRVMVFFYKQEIKE